MDESNIGIQLYSVRNELKSDFEGTLVELSRMGFRGVEFAFNYGGLDPSALSALLKENGLQTIGIYEKLDNILDPGAEVYRQAEALECRHLTFGLQRERLEKDFLECLDLCRKAVNTAADRNMILCYHAHAHEFLRYEGEYYLDLLLNAGGLENMAFEADTCWIHQGGENVVDYMEKYADRIPLLHVKDVTAEGRIVELGKGVIDFPPVVAFARKHNIPWLSYEQDTSKLAPLESARISIAYIKTLLK